MPHKSSFDEVAKQKAIDKALDVDTNTEGIQEPSRLAAARKAREAREAKAKRPKKGSFRQRAATAGSLVARGVDKVYNMTTPADLTIAAAKSFKKTLINKDKERKEEEDPNKAESKKQGDA